MKRNMIVAAGTALVLAFILNTSQAQDNAPSPAPTPASTPPVAGAVPGHPVPPGLGPNGRPLPPRMRQPRVLVMRAQSELRNVKMALQASAEDYGGHKESAIAACEKALAELDAVMKAMPQPPPPAQRPGGPASGQPQPQQNLSPQPPSGGNAPASAPSAPPAKTPEP